MLLKESREKAPSLDVYSSRIGAFLYYINFPSTVLTVSGSMGIISAESLSTP